MSAGRSGPGPFGEAVVKQGPTCARPEAVAGDVPAALPDPAGSVTRSTDWHARLGPLDFSVGIRRFELRGVFPEQPPPHEEKHMAGQPSFTEAIRALASGLRESAHSHVSLNRASSGIDHLGRQLHGVGYVRDREIAGCLTAALGELSASHALAEEDRAEAVRRGIGHLDAALAHAEEGGISTAP